MAFPNIHRTKRMPEPITGTPPDLIRPPSGCRFHPRCDYAGEICRELEPGMTAAGEGHTYACHFGGAFNG
jgi:peptide/nickel transport system ATP-binding protein